MTASDSSTSEYENEWSRLTLHVPCLRLHGKTPYGWQACRCEPPATWPGCDVSRVADLCTICGRGTAGGVSRWAWLGCRHCCAIEHVLRNWLGICVTPLGRHSIQNGVGVRVGRTSVGDSTAFAQALQPLQRGWSELASWGDQEVGRLVARLPHKAEDFPISDWMDIFPPSTNGSLDAYQRYLRIPLPADIGALADERLLDIEQARVRAALPPQRVPCAAWLLDEAGRPAVCGEPTDFAVSVSSDGRERPLCVEHLLICIGDGEIPVFRAQGLR